MEMSATQKRPHASAAPSSSLSQHLGPPVLLVTLAAAAAAIAIQSLWLPIDADVSWLITVCERVLSGDRLYIDILEVNPPASAWLYLPFVWLAKLTSLRPEAMVAGAFITAGIASTLVTVKIASRLDERPQAPALAAGVAIIALVLPMALFAEREHAALLLALPTFAAMALVGEGKPMGRSRLAACGFAAGLILVIKPYFLLALLPPAIWAAWKRGSVRPLLTAVAGASVAIALYGAAVLVLAKAYFALLPTIARTYAGVHDDWWKLLVGPAFFPAVAAALGAVMKPRKASALTWTWGLGAAGFLLATLAQGKNFPNHWLPQAGLAFAAVTAMIALPIHRSPSRKLVAAALAIVGLAAMDLWAIRPDPAIAAAIRAVAPVHPKIIALSTQLATGHPVTRNVDGHWVGSRPALFTAAGAGRAGLGDPQVRQAYRQDIDSFPADVARRSPDVVLVSKYSKPWLMAEPAIARAMANYRPVAQAGDTEIWVKRVPRR